MNMNNRICVFGSYKNLGKKEKENTIHLGRLLAENGFTVVSGGFSGTMEDVSRGAHEAGGKTIGVTYYKCDDTKKCANKYIDEEIRTESIFERISVMLKASDGFIVLPGGTGTLLELAALLEEINKGLMSPKPVIALGHYWEDTLKVLSEEAVLSESARRFYSAISCRDLVSFVDTPEQAIAVLAR